MLRVAFNGFNCELDYLKDVYSSEAVMIVQLCIMVSPITV